MVRHHRRDHLPDRCCLSMSPFYVLALKPVEAAIGIVRSLLLGKKQSESEAVGQRRPSRLEIIAGRALRAACRFGWQVAEHSQRARVWPEIRGFGQMIGHRRERSRRFDGRRGLYDLLPLIRPRQQIPKSLPNFNHLVTSLSYRRLRHNSLRQESCCDAAWRVTPDSAIFLVTLWPLLLQCKRQSPHERHAGGPPRRSNAHVRIKICETSGEENN